MVQTFGTFKSLADRLDREAIERTKAAAANKVEKPFPVATHQERVNVEMFRAIEMLGRKIDRIEDGREHLSRRVALIESAASVDEKTGKLYLPVVMDSPLPAAAPAGTVAAVPKWMLASTLLSGAVAVLALALVVFRPVPPPLTPEQLAILNALAETRMGALTGPLAPEQSAQNWQTIEDAPQAVPPSSEELTAAPASEYEMMEPGVTTLPASEDAASALVGDSASVEAPAATETIETTETAEVSAPVEEPAPAAAAAAQDTDIPQAPPAPVTPPVVLAAPDNVTAAVTEDAKPQAPATTAPGAAASDTPPPPLVAGLDIGRDPNLPAALADVETRAMEGIPAAQHDLATIYAAGKQTAQDYKRAVYWFAQAAEGGIANAHYNLGVMFQQGLGVKKDTGKAMGWYVKAAELGHPEAMYNLGIAYIEGVGIARNIDKGISYFTQAAENGVSQAAFNLGVLYESGFSGPVDLATARNWYEKAAKDGHKDAQDALARLDGKAGAAVAAAPPQSLTQADMVEPAAGEAKAIPLKAADKKAAPAPNNDLVRKVQQALIRRGLLPAPPTGIMDDRTQDAIRAWQSQNGLPTDGAPSLELLGRLTDTSGGGSNGGTGTAPPPRIPTRR